MQSQTKKSKTGKTGTTGTSKSGAASGSAAPNRGAGGTTNKNTKESFQKKLLIC